jgi:hypothetical protein
MDDSAAVQPNRGPGVRASLAVVAATFAAALVVSAEGGATFAAAHRAGPPAAAAAVYRHEAHVQLARTGVDCSAYAVRAYALMRAHGIPVRIVVTAASASLFDSHTFVEAQRPDGTWVAQDPTFDGWWSIDGRPASAADLQAALVERRLSAVRWHGPAAAITDYYVNPLLLFRTVGYYVINGRGSPVRVDERTVDLPTTYYASPKRDGGIAQVLVVRGGSNWRIGSYPLIDEPGDVWVSPIAIVDGLHLRGNGHSSVTTLNVPRFPASQVARS